jgi:hypothetical protein
MSILLSATKTCLTRVKQLGGCSKVTVMGALIGGYPGVEWTWLCSLGMWSAPGFMNRQYRNLESLETEAVSNGKNHAFKSSTAGHSSVTQHLFFAAPSCYYKLHSLLARGNSS